MVYRNNAMTSNPNWYTVGNWLTIGTFDMVKGSIAPEKPYSLQHWLDSAGTALLFVGSGGAIVETTSLKTGVKGAGKLISSNNPNDYLKAALKTQNLKKAPDKLKAIWSQDGFDFEVRIHAADPRYDKTGSIYRVARRQQGMKPGTNQGYGWEYLGSDGIWYHTSVLNAGNDAAAKATHIQLK